MVLLEVIPQYRDKETCMTTAEQIIRSGKVGGMTALDIAKEIFSHATIFYCASWLHDHGLRQQYLLEHSNPIDIMDGGDTIIRKIIYNVIWIFARTHVCEGKKDML